jgi:hypothetical protein
MRKKLPVSVVRCQSLLRQPHLATETDEVFILNCELNEFLKAH